MTVREATPADLNRSASAIIKLAEANGYTVRAQCKTITDVDRKGLPKDHSVDILAVGLYRNMKDHIIAYWRDGSFDFARPAYEWTMFGGMNHTQLRAVITGTWQDLPRCDKCRRWNAPCKCNVREASDL